MRCPLCADPHGCHLVGVEHTYGTDCDKRPGIPAGWVHEATRELQWARDAREATAEAQRTRGALAALYALLDEADRKIAPFEGHKAVVTTEDVRAALAHKGGAA